MKLLVDESLASRVASLLANAGHDAIHVGDRDLLGASDEMVLATARREGRVVITADTDFGTLLAFSGTGQPSVVLLRRPGRRAEQRAQAVMDAISTVGDVLDDGALVAFACGLCHSTDHELAMLADTTATNSCTEPPRGRDS